MYSSFTLFDFAVDETKTSIVSGIEIAAGTKHFAWWDNVFPERFRWKQTFALWKWRVRIYFDRGWGQVPTAYAHTNMLLLSICLTSNWTCCFAHERKPSNPQNGTQHGTLSWDACDVCADVYYCTSKLNKIVPANKNMSHCYNDGKWTELFAKRLPCAISKTGGMMLHFLNSLGSEIYMR